MRHSGILCRLFVILTLASSASLGFATPGKSDANPQIYSDAKQLLLELERIRFIMGKPASGKPTVSIENPNLWEVFFHAKQLNDRAIQLGFEIYLRHEPKIDTPATEISGPDIGAALTDTLTIVGKAQKRLRIAASETRVMEDDQSLTVALADILRASQQIDLLVEHHIQPSDVYAKTLENIELVKILLGHLNTDFQEPMPAYASGKQPKDVLVVQYECYQVLNRIVTAVVGDTGTRLKIPDQLPDTLPPAEVMFLAEQNHANLLYLYRWIQAQGGTLPAPEKPAYPGRKFPSDVYQQATVLKALLLSLQAQVDAAPLKVSSHQGI